MAAVQIEGYAGILSLVEVEAQSALGPIMVGYAAITAQAEVTARAATTQLQGRALIEATCEITLARRLPLRGVASIQSGFEAVIYTALFSLAIDAESRLTAKGSLDCRQHGMLLNRLATQVYNLWGYEVKTASSITFARPRVVEVINQALQLVYSAAKAVDYFARVTETLTFAQDVNTAVLPVGVQHLLGPVRYQESKQPLAPVGSINDFHSYLDIYGVNASSPRIYFLNRANAAGQDNAGLTVHIAPTPTIETVFEYEYAMQAPRYTEADILANARVPMPHSYVESLLLPVVKHLAASDSLFRREEMRPVIAADYTRARQMLGIVDPEPTATARNKPKGAAAES